MMTPSKYSWLIILWDIFSGSDGDTIGESRQYQPVLVGGFNFFNLQP
jgi:hypothetical protein